MNLMSSEEVNQLCEQLADEIDEFKNQLAESNRKIEEAKELARQYSAERNALAQNLIAEPIWKLYWTSSLSPHEICDILGMYRSHACLLHKFAGIATAIINCEVCGNKFKTPVSSRAQISRIVPICGPCNEKRKSQLADISANDKQLFSKRYSRLETMPYDEYLRTPEWRSIREAAVRKAGYSCQLCNSGGMLHVHHRTYERRGYESPSDLIVLCSNCHAKFHDKLEAGNE